MTWFKIDDKLHAHPKWWALSPLAKALWTTAGAWSASYKTDGLILDSQLTVLAPQVGVTPAAVRKAAKELVEARMWVIEGEAFRFHKWTEFNPPRATLEKEAAIEKERKKIQNDPDLKAAVRLRDHDRCRYCGILVDFGARTGHKAGRYDHVLPVTKGGKTEVNNVVVACNYDNGRKYNKTLEEAEMVLLDPGTPAPTAELGLRNGLVFSQSKARKRHGSGPGSGLDDSWSDRDDAGLVEHGAGLVGEAPPGATSVEPEHGTLEQPIPSPVEAVA